MVAGKLLGMAQPASALSDAFAAVVKRHRERKALSRAALARLSGLHQTYIGLLERGQRSPNLETAEAIAVALGYPLGRLIVEAEQFRKSNRGK